MNLMILCPLSPKILTILLNDTQDVFFHCSGVVQRPLLLYSYDDDNYKGMQDEKSIIGYNHIVSGFCS